MVSELAPGTILATRYRVERVIGRGGMGVVYRALQLPMERPVALKVLRPELTGDPRARARFEREARAASALAHPAAVVIHDFGEHEGMAYLAMELVEGRGLRALVDEGVSTERAIELSHQLADVLAAAHRAGLVHRDLKPENVIVREEGQEPIARVLDFGLAFLDERGPGGRMTREGVVVGTPEYLSPEQARGEEVGPPTDVYALGCVLHELLTGRPPFSGTEMDVLTKQLFAPPPPLSRAGALDPRDVPALLDELRRAMLDKRPAARPTAEEVRDRLSALDPDPARARAPGAGGRLPRAARAAHGRGEGRRVAEERGDDRARRDRAARRQRGAGPARERDRGLRGERRGAGRGEHRGGAGARRERGRGRAARRRRAPGARGPRPGRRRQALGDAARGRRRRGAAALRRGRARAQGPPHRARSSRPGRVSPRSAAP
ncbi:MAG: serine/threonine protein kinase [Sandaracinaceae bacterium]|nr:serine/threonine protein kinase [Sandaracinaceae bacterium]